MCGHKPEAELKLMCRTPRPQLLELLLRLLMAQLEDGSASSQSDGASAAADSSAGLPNGSSHSSSDSSIESMPADGSEGKQPPGKAEAPSKQYVQVKDCLMLLS